MKKILIINGPNLNLLGRREPDIYGSRSFVDYLKTIEALFPDVQLRYFQSNHEGELLDKIHELGFEVDGIVMKKEVRGTSKDPRAGSEEKWLVKVEMVEVGRRFNIYTDRAHYDKVKAGDRVKVRYSEGKYTGTVWGSEIED